MKKTYLDALGIPCLEAWVRRNEDPLSRSSFIDMQAIGALQGSDPTFLVDDGTFDEVTGWDEESQLKQDEGNFD